VGSTRICGHVIMLVAYLHRSTRLLPECTFTIISRPIYYIYPIFTITIISVRRQQRSVASTQCYLDYEPRTMRQDAEGYCSRSAVSTSNSLFTGADMCGQSKHAERAHASRPTAPTELFWTPALYRAFLSSRVFDETESWYRNKKALL